MYDHEQFYRALLTALDAPVNERNLLALRAWQRCEDSEAQYNPFDTTEPEPGDNEYNSFESGGVTLHVWNYPNEQEGVQATVDTLHNGHYPHIVTALKDGTGRICYGEAADEMHVWGTHPDCIAEHLRGTAVAEEPVQQQQNPAGERVPFGHDMRDWLGRTLRHLQTRDHPLPEHDANLLQRVAEEAKRVEHIGQHK